MEYGKEWAKELLERGPVSTLELLPEELSGLTVAMALRLTRQVCFLRAFCRRGIALDGCAAANISRGTVDYWRADYEWFDPVYQVAILEACDGLEQEAYRRAVEGTDEPVIFQGLPTVVRDAASGLERTLTVKKYSDALLTTLLKGAMPDKYRDNVKQTHDFGGQTGVLIVPGPIDPAAWEAAAREQQAKYAGNTGEDAPQ